MTRSEPADDSATENRRQFGRYEVGSEQVEVVVGRWRKTGTIVDESIGGIGIRTDEIIGLSEGQEVQIVYNGGQESKGYVRNLRREPDEGGFWLGIGWTAPPKSAVADTNTGTAKQLVASYVGHAGIHVVCHACSTENGGSEITLWDGSKFPSQPDKIMSLTRSGREKNLRQLENQVLKLIPLLYGLEPAPAAATIEQVLDFEFNTFTQS